MQQAAKNSLSILGIALVVSSLWFTWLSFQQVPVESEMLKMQQALMGGSGPTTYSGTMGGFDGSLLHVPIWIVAALISMAHASQLMDASNSFYVPSFVKWALLIVALMFPVFAIVYPLFCPGITPSLGPCIALLSSAIAFITLLVPENSATTQNGIAG